jgi:hypothetical protein
MERFTPAQRLARFTVFFSMAVLLAVSMRTVSVIPEFLWDAPQQMADLFGACGRRTRPATPSTSTVRSSKP